MPNRTTSKPHIDNMDTQFTSVSLDPVQRLSEIRDFLQADKQHYARMTLTISNLWGFVKYAEGDLKAKRGLLLANLTMYQNDDRYHQVDDSNTDPHNRDDPNLPENFALPFDPTVTKKIQLRINVDIAEIGLEGQNFSANVMQPQYTNGLVHGFGALQDKSDQGSSQEFSTAYFTLAVQMGEL